MVSTRRKLSGASEEAGVTAPVHPQISSTRLPSRTEPHIEEKLIGEVRLDRTGTIEKMEKEGSDKNGGEGEIVRKSRKPAAILFKCMKIQGREFGDVEGLQIQFPPKLSGKIKVAQK
jgi:hypothetical protein